MNAVKVVSALTAVSTVALSMALNVWAFTSHMEGVFAWTVGLMLPLWVLSLTFLGKHFADQGHTKVSVAAFVLAGFLLLVSMPHLARGFDHITGSQWWESWSLAIVTDLTQVVVKLALVMQANEQHASKRQPKAKSLKIAA